MQRVRMLWVYLKYVFIHRLRFSKTSDLMNCEGLLKSCRDFCQR